MILTQAVYESLNDWEKAVAGWLMGHEIPFEVEQKFYGGTTELGGMLVDFVLPDRSIIIRVMGHYHQSIEHQGRDEYQRVLLSQAFTVIDLWERHIENLDVAMRQVLRGEQPV